MMMKTMKVGAGAKQTATPPARKCWLATRRRWRVRPWWRKLTICRRLLVWRKTRRRGKKLRIGSLVQVFVFAPQAQEDCDDEQVSRSFGRDGGDVGFGPRLLVVLAAAGSAGVAGLDSAVSDGRDGGDARCFRVDGRELGPANLCGLARVRRDSEPGRD